MFRIYNVNSNIVFTSADGLTWNEVALTVAPGSSFPTGGGSVVGKIEYHPALNKFVSIAQGWRRQYEDTEYYHSDDGIEWAQVNKAAGDAPASPHPVRHIKAGYITNCQ